MYIIFFLFLFHTFCRYTMHDYDTLNIIILKCKKIFFFERERENIKEVQLNNIKKNDVMMMENSLKKKNNNLSNLNSL